MVTTILAIPYCLFLVIYGDHDQVLIACRNGEASLLLPSSREIHNLDPQPHRHCMLGPRASAHQVTRCSLGKYWSRDFFQKEAESSRQGVGNPEPYLFCAAFI